MRCGAHGRCCQPATPTGMSRRRTRPGSCGSPRRAARCCIAAQPARGMSTDPTTEPSSADSTSPTRSSNCSGISTAEGKVKPSRMSKFRQVQDLLAALDPLIDDAVALGPGDDLSPERPLRVVDLGCGNAYLTFAAFRYLTAVKELPVAGGRSRRQGAGAGAQHRSRRASRRRGHADLRPEPDRVRRARPMLPISCWPCMPATRRPTTRWRERSAGRRP